jgi:hypothetical protein
MGTRMPRLLVLSLLLPCVALAQTVMSPAASARYQQATAKIQAAAYGDAITILNELAAEYPRIAEVFAARCSAQVGMKSFQGAEADCNYAIGLKPLPVAIYTLAIAQEGLGNRDAAAANYRRYATYELSAAPYRDQALARATALGGQTPPPLVGIAAAPSAGGKLIVYRNHRFAGSSGMTLVLDNRMVGDLAYGESVQIEAAPGEHLLEVRSHTANGYEAPKVWTRPFQLGSQPVYANLDTLRGTIVLQEVPAAQARTELRESEIKQAYSRRITPESPEAPAVARATVLLAAQPTECRMGSNGRQACGYNCRIGSDGIAACADTPNGVCGINAWGQVTCSNVGGSGAVFLGGPKPECRMGSHGRQTCGYNCRLGSRGSFYCASRPDGQCAMNSDGSWTCP